MLIPYLPWQRKDSDDRADRPCLRDDQTELTYADFDGRVEAFAGQLHEAGIGPGDVVAVMLANRVELVIVLFAAWRLGAAVTPVNPAFTATEADHQIADSGAALVVNLGPTSPTGGRPSIHVCDMVTIGEGCDETMRLAPRTTSLDELALLVYTSGSTGRPKGVMLSHGNVLAMAQQMAQHLKVTTRDHCLLILPLFHVNAVLVSVLTPMLVGAQITVMGAFRPEPFLKLIEDLRPTYFSGVPTIYAMLASLPEDVIPDTSSLRLAICGAAPISQELLARSEERFGFTMVEGYGLTEGTCCSACNPIDGVRKIGTVGPTLDGQQIRIVDQDGKDVPLGAEGEVLIAGPTVMQGYFRMPEETNETLVDGWLRTGDVGRLDEDGYLTLVDRIKDMIIRGGENLYPKEIENAIAGLGAVLEVAVVGRADHVLGEVPVAFVVPYPEVALTSEEVMAHCIERLTRVKVPVEVTVIDSLPKNPVGKIDKPTLRATVPSQQ